MSWLAETDPIRAGYWGPITSTLLWCERKYEWSYYMAEPVNTLTNLWFMGIALYGAYRVYTERLPARFYVCALGICAVGLGSFLFHMTLQHEAQLLDELPMIWVSTYLSWSLVDQTLFYGQRKGPLLPLAMLGLVVFITVTYMVNDNPVFHQVAYATIFGATVLHGIYVLFASTSPLNTNDAARRARADARYLQLVGTVTFLTGFLIWNIDNVFCGTLRAARDAIGYPWAVLLEGHGWWHILTGYGAYLLLVSCEVIVLAHMEHPANICVRYGVMPYVRRVRDNDPRRLLLDEYRARKLN